MSEPFLAEIRIVGFNFAPQGYATCDGQILPINQNQALFSLLGTTYGGDGRSTFGLPDLRGRAPVHVGNGDTLGTRGGEENHVLDVLEVPSHDHALRASTDDAGGTTNPPASNVLSATNTDIYGAPDGNMTSIHPGVVATVGGQGHNNMQPFLVLNFVIALQGSFPPQN